MMQQSIQTTKKNKPTELPFYAIPQISKTSAEIISEARASIRTVNTKRPFTPRNENRRLFGESSGTIPRPPSSFSLGKLHYETGESSRPVSAGLRLQPLGHNPVVRRTITSSNASSHRDSETGRVRLPSIPNDKGFSLENYFSLVLPDGITAKTLRTRRHSQPITRAKFEFPQCERTIGDGVEQISAPNDLKISLSKSLKTASEHPISISPDEPPVPVEEALYKKKIVPLLDEMFTESKDKQHYLKVVKKLYETLDSAGLLGKNFSLRSTILKLLYKMLDSADNHVQLQLARLILAMKVKGNNLSNLCKLIFKITRNEDNDQLFLEDNFLELFLLGIKKMNCQQDSEALVYSIGALKFLSMNGTFLRELCKLGCIEILTGLVTNINTLKKESSKFSQQTGHVLFQVTGCLRNLAEGSANRHTFISSGVITQLCISLELFSGDVDIITNIARILSKLTMHSDVCAIVSQNENNFCVMISLLQRYEKRQELVVRLGFILGNLTAKNDDARVLLFSQPLCLDTFLSLIGHYMASCVENRSNETKEIKDEEVPVTLLSNNKELGIADFQDVMVKTVRVIANMSIHLDVGPVIAANHPCLDLILSLLNLQSDLVKSEELTLSVLATLNNLSYYSLDKGAVAARQLEITESLIKILMNEKLTELVEVMRVFGNLSRTHEVRQYLAGIKMLQMMITLLDSGNKDLVFTSCGVLINFMADEDKRMILKNEGGVQKLIDVLKDFGNRDWQLASMVCQTLWNYTTKISSTPSILTDTEMMQLVSILEEYLNESVAMTMSCNDKMDQFTHENVHDEWTYVFCPVAENLLKRVERFFSSEQMNKHK